MRTINLESTTDQSLHKRVREANLTVDHVRCLFLHVFDGETQGRIEFSNHR